MSRRILAPRSNLCHFCEYVTSTTRPSRNIPRALTSTRKLTTSRRIGAQTQGRAISPKSKGARSAGFEEGLDTRVKGKPSHVPTSNTTVGPGLLPARKACELLLSRQDAPSEQETLATLQICEHIARTLVEDPSKKTPIPKDGTAVSAILSLDKSKAKTNGSKTILQENKASIDELSQLVHAVIRHAPVYITSEVLKAYVNIQAILGRAETFPEVLNLYANKPVPEEGSSPIRYIKQNPNKVANAIPTPTAERALQAAIEARQLGAAIDIVDICYTTTAFLRSKFVRRALLPTTAALVAPVAAYSVASQMALYQTTMDSDMATNIAFVGILAYMGFTGSIGMVALTTANDQMDRVTWAPGMPLHERWVREDERAAIDKIAGSWGFRESWRRGEEEGEEWEALREWIGRKGMLLDRVELMEGME